MGQFVLNSPTRHPESTIKHLIYHILTLKPVTVPCLESRPAPSLSTTALVLCKETFRGDKTDIKWILVLFLFCYFYTSGHLISLCCHSKAFTVTLFAVVLWLGALLTSASHNQQLFPGSSPQVDCRWRSSLKVPKATRLSSDCCSPIREPLVSSENTVTHHSSGFWCST